MRYFPALSALTLALFVCPGGVEFCVVIVAALIQKCARLLTTTYSTGVLRGTAGVPGPGPMVSGALRVGAGVILGYPRVRIQSGIRLRLRDATLAVSRDRTG